MYDIKKLPSHILKRIHFCQESGCWIYKGKDPSSNGYQRGWYKGVRSAIHRITYTILVGGDIEGKDLDHECCNVQCCNPAHLTPMTHKKNCRLREKRRRARQA